MKTKTLKWIWPVVLAIVVAAPAAAEVSIDEILRLHSAGLSAQSLLLVVQASDTPDTISTEQLTALLEAGVPDTVITMLVVQADVVAEDWQPVDVDEGVEEYRVVTRTRYVDPYYDYYDPGWTFSVGVWWGNPYYWSYWDRPLYCDPWYDPWTGGWCATSWYSYGPGCYDPWYYRPRVFVGFGWYPYRYAWCPYNYGYHHGGYYAYYDHNYSYDNRGIFDRLRDDSRPDYRHTVNRSIVDGSDGKSYRGTTTDHRRDAPLTRVSTGLTKDMRTDNRTGLRDLNDTEKRAERDISKRRIDGSTLDAGPRTKDKSTRYDRSLKSLADEKTAETQNSANDAKGQVQRTDKTSLFDRYGDVAKNNAEKVERYRAMKEGERQVTRGGTRAADRSNAGEHRSATGNKSTVRAYPGRRGDMKSRASSRATAPSSAPAATGQKPAKVEAKQGEKKSDATVAPAARPSTPNKMTPQIQQRGASNRDAGTRSSQSTSKRSGSSSEGKSRGRKP